MSDEVRIHPKSIQQRNRVAKGINSVNNVLAKVEKKGKAQPKPSGWVV